MRKTERKIHLFFRPLVKNERKNLNFSLGAVNEKSSQGLFFSHTSHQLPNKNVKLREQIMQKFLAKFYFYFSSSANQDVTFFSGRGGGEEVQEISMTNLIKRVKISHRSSQNNKCL